MRRAWQRPVVGALAALGLWLAGAGQAGAFHAASTFADPPGAGGGGGLFYVGSPRERGWTCTACHVEAPGELRVRFVTELFDGFAYEPGQQYDVEVRIEEEHHGLGSPLSNFNSMVLLVRDAEGAGAGTFAGFAAEEFYLRSTSMGDSVLASAGQDPNQTAWTFTWTAPPAGRGELTFHLGVVDGNGADSPPTETLTDPFGDDVYVAEVSVDEVGAGERGAAAPTGLPWTLFAVGSALAWRRRRR